MLLNALHLTVKYRVSMSLYFRLIHNFV